MKTNADYKVNFKVANTDYGTLTIPKGTRLSHQTAMGIDKSYHFVTDLSWVKEHVSGLKQYGLIHDLEHYGINVPKEYVEYEN
jgi:hypothetical protein